MHAHTKPPSHTWTRLSLAWLCGYTTARLAAVFWRGVTASASMHAIAASNRAFIAPFAPAPIHNVAVVVEIAPVSRATDRQAERVNADEIASLRTHATVLLTPGSGDCAMQIVAVRPFVRGQRSINSECNEYFRCVYKRDYKREIRCSVEFLDACESSNSLPLQHTT